MALQSARDIPLRVSSENASTERRITPSWTVSQLKGKLESVTGIPPSCQKLVLRVPGHGDTVIAASDEDKVQVGSWRLQVDAEIHVRSLLEFWCYCVLVFLRRVLATAALPCSPRYISPFKSFTYCWQTSDHCEDSIFPWLRISLRQGYTLHDTDIKACCSTHTLWGLSI